MKYSPRQLAIGIKNAKVAIECLTRQDKEHFHDLIGLQYHKAERYQKMLTATKSFSNRLYPEFNK